MQHVFKLLRKISFSLYVAALALAIPNARAQLAEETSKNHVAVILPLKSESLGRQADAVRQGVLQAAAANKQGLPVIVHATSDDAKEIQAAYERATNEGARAVIGPLSRSAVTALAVGGQIKVPTLALNSPEGELIMPRHLYIFGLQVDTEARQLARVAAKRGLKRVFIVAAETPVSSRIAQAFKEEWQARGGAIAEEFAYNTDPGVLSKLKDRPQATNADIVLLALDSSRAKLARPYINGTLPVFATSLAYNSNDPLENFELDGVMFLDMPWLLLPDHAAVVTYNRGLPFASLETQRFFALGIDAYRIVQELINPYLKIDEEPIDGVTGLILRGDNQRFVRELTPADFHNGIARSLADTAYR
jgi:uncharacterized protein